MGSSHSRSLESIRIKKNEERALLIKESLAKIETILKNENITNQLIQKITRLKLEQIVEQLNSHRITSKQLTTIYCSRTADVGLKLNLITEVNFQNALKMAQECDNIRQREKKMNWTFKEGNEDPQKFLPPLFGIPISIKDTFDMKGLSSSVGITHRAYDLKQQDGFLVQAIKSAGMIPFTKSNVPQLAMTFQSHNFLWGRGKNPWNQLRGIGGSSGGEGGLVAARCSPIGIGSDVGGSIRIPTQFCGVFGLKSSDSRLSNSTSTDYNLSFSGMDTLKVITGPIGNSVQSLALWMKVATNQSNYKGNHDAYNKLIPFDSKLYNEYQHKKKLKIGYIKSLSILESTKASQRAVQETINLIKQLGHEAVPVQIPNEKEVVRAFFSEFSAEGDSLTFKDMLKGQQFIAEYNQVNMLAGMNSKLFWLVNKIYNRTAPRIGFLLQGSAKKTVHEYLIHAGKVLGFKKQFVQYWRKNQLDFIVMPGFGSQANLHGYSQKTSLAACYTFMWNVLGTTVGTMPITICKQNQQVYQSHYADDITHHLKQTAKGSAGLPVGIQVIGLPFEDQKVLGFMKTLQAGVKFYKKHPLPQC